MTSINAAEMARWTPVGIDLEADTPWIEWGDFDTLRFTDPFFFATVRRWLAADPPPRLVRTDLDALTVLDQAPSLDPSGLIFHLPRSGSTLLVQLLRQIPGCLVMSEPEPVNTLLAANTVTFEGDTQAQILKFLIRAFGRRRFGDERHYVVKLSSWNVRAVELFRRAFPMVPIVWLQRKPIECLMSLLADPPRWLALRDDPDLIACLFEIAAGDEPTRLPPEALYARALAAQLKSVEEASRRGAVTVIDYSDLPAAAWTSVAPLFGIAPAADDIAQMVECARLDAKAAEPRAFVVDRHQRDSPQSIDKSAEEHLDELYRKLKALTASRPDLPRSVRAPD